MAAVRSMKPTLSPGLVPSVTTGHVGLRRSPISPPPPPTTAAALVVPPTNTISTTLKQRVVPSSPTSDEEETNGGLTPTSAAMLTTSVSPQTSPNGSPSMTQRRGINLRIQVIPPDDESLSGESDEDTEEPELNNHHHNNNYISPYGSGNWSPPISPRRPHSAMQYLQLPSNPELSPSYYSSSTPSTSSTTKMSSSSSAEGSQSTKSQQRRRYSTCSCCSECCNGGGAATGSTMNYSPSNMSLASSPSFMSTNQMSLADGPLSPYCVSSPTSSRPPSVFGWRSRSYTTVQHRQHRAATSALSTSSIVDGGNGPSSPPIISSSPIGGGGSSSAQLRSSRSWTFVGPSSVWTSVGGSGASASGRQSGGTVSAASGETISNNNDCAFVDRGLMWTPPPQAPSPHPLGYYSDSPPPLYSSSFVSGRTGGGGGGSPLLASKMIQRTASDSGDHPSPPVPPVLLHRASVSGGTSGSAGASSSGGGGRRFSTSLHHPQYYYQQHCYHPPTHQYNPAGGGHPSGGHQQSPHPPSHHMNATAAALIGQRVRRDSASGYGQPVGHTYSTGTVSSWDSPTGSSSNLHRMRHHHLGQSCPQLSSLVGSQSSNSTSASTSAAASPGGHLTYNFGLLAPGNMSAMPMGGSGGAAAVKLRREISIQRRHSHRMSRRSFHANTSPIMGAAAQAAANALGAQPPPCCRSPARQGSPILGLANDAPSTSMKPSCSHHGNAAAAMQHQAVCGAAAATAPGHASSSRHHHHQQQQQHAEAGAQVARPVPLRQNSLRVHHGDARRWSVASLPSSGYGTPGSSAMSSQYSSQERLAAALEEQQRCRYGSNDSNPFEYAYYMQHSNSQTPAPNQQPQQQQHQHQHGHHHHHHHHQCQHHQQQSCQNSGQSDYQTPGHISPRMRIRSRSLSSLAWLNLSSSRLDNSSSKIMSENVEVALRNNIYKEKFPKAKRQMEEKLETFLSENALLSSSGTSSSYHLAALSSSSQLSDTSSPGSLSVTNSASNVAALLQNSSSTGSSLTVPGHIGSQRSSSTSVAAPVVAVDSEALKLLTDGSARFIHLQIMELVADCLQKSKHDTLSSAFFYELSQNLEDLLVEAKEKASPEAFDQLSALVRKLFIIISRPARLLECLEFDPEEFYRLLQEAEGQAKQAQRSGQNESVPQYIIRQLGLGRQAALPDLPSSLTQTADPSQLSATSAAIPFDRPPSSATPETSRRKATAAPPKEDDFEIIKLISNGAYGAVYLVRHRETRRRFALKKLNKSNLMLRNQIDQVYAERDILTFTDNPFVVSFYGSFETKKHLCMLMEYVEGGDCATLLKSTGILPAELCRLYIAETILAIEYLHSYGIVHRDLKPDNLLITALGHIKLTDFGLSKIGLMNRTNLLYEGYFDALMTETTQFQDRQICGTPEYIAPEVILRQGYGKPVDWWALGVILYEFLIGTVPFFGETPEELFAHVISDEIEWPEEPYAPSEESQDLVIGLLQQNPLERLGTVNGAIELKEHKFFESLDWNSLLRQKAEFIPQLEGEDDTSYFDTRVDRYQHDLDSADDDGSVYGDAEVGSMKESSSSLFASFSSCSPRFSMLADQTIARANNDSFYGGHSLDRSDSLNSSGASVVMEPLPLSPSVSYATGLQAPTMDGGHPSVSPSPSFRGFQSVVAAQSEMASSGESTKPKTDTSGIEQSDVGTPSYKVLQSMSATDEAQVQWRRRTNASPLQHTKQQTIPTTVISTAPSTSDSTTTGHQSTAKITNKELSPVDESSAVSPTSPPTPSTAPKSSATTAAITKHQTTPIICSKQSSLQPHQSSTPQHSVQRQLSAPPARHHGHHPHPHPHHHHHTQGLHLVIPGEISTTAPMAMAPQSPTLSSGGSSRDASPTSLRRRRTMTGPTQQQQQQQHSGGSQGSTGTTGSGGGAGSDTQLTNQPKTSIVIRRGPKGFGFTIRAIRVYLGESDYYTIQHLVMAVEPGSPACDAGLRANDLITHVNGESVQNLTHPEVVQRLMSSSTEALTLRVSPLESTSIRQGGARKSAGKLVKRSGYKQKLQKRALDKNKRKTSLFRRLSGKRVSAELSAAGIGPTTAGGLLATASTAAALAGMAGGHLAAASLQRSISHTEGSLGGGGGGGQAMPKVPSPTPGRTRGDSSSSQSSSPVSSVPNSPALMVCPMGPPMLDLLSSSSMTPPSTLSPSSSASTPPSSSRPSSLHGLKHKLAQTLRSPSRRKHAQTMPLSPLARTQPPALQGEGSGGSGGGPFQGNLLTSGHISPTRSPSPLALQTASVTAVVKSPPVIVPMVKKTITKPKKSDTSSISSTSSGFSGISLDAPPRFLLGPSSSRSPTPRGGIGGGGNLSDSDGITKKILKSDKADNGRGGSGM